MMMLRRLGEGAAGILGRQTDAAKLHKRTHRASETLRFAQGCRSGTPRGRLHKRTHRDASRYRTKVRKQTHFIRKIAGLFEHEWRATTGGEAPPSLTSWRPECHQP